LLQWFTNYLLNRQQRVVINGQHSAWGDVKAGVPQGSVLGPLLFLTYINDITENINTNIRLFADDTALYVTVGDPNESNDMLNLDLRNIVEWSNLWLVKFSAPKTKAMTMTLKQNDPSYPPLRMDNAALLEVQDHKHLGVTFTSNLSWSTHIASICTTASKRLDIMAGLKNRLDKRSLDTMYKSFVRPLMEYADVLWDGCYQRDADNLEMLQHRASRIVSGAIRGTPTVDVYTELAWEPLFKRRERHKLIMFYKIVNGLTPSFLSDLLPPRVEHRTRYNLRNDPNLTSFAARTELFKRSFFPSTTPLWNSLSPEIRNSENIRTFKKHLNQDVPQPKPWYNAGGRRLSLIHAQLRMGCSNLSGHLHNLHVLDTPACFCGYRNENCTHFLLHCPLFQNHRIERDNRLSNLDLAITFNIEILLYGTDDITVDQNIDIALIVQRYINDTRRFN
jgi:ribonuclease P/MRP protein subunit RPP40